jgi:hypothetical protein
MPVCLYACMARTLGMFAPEGYQRCAEKMTSDVGDELSPGRRSTRRGPGCRPDRTGRPEGTWMAERTIGPSASQPSSTGPVRSEKGRPSEYGA